MDKELHSALLNELTDNIEVLKGHGTVTMDNHVMSSNELINESIHLLQPVSYTHLTLPTNHDMCRSRWSPYH